MLFSEVQFFSLESILVEAASSTSTETFKKNLKQKKLEQISNGCLIAIMMFLILVSSTGPLETSRSSYLSSVPGCMVDFVIKESG